MTRAELHRLADDRVADAAALLAAGRWSGAYYLAGYAVECALKACIAKGVRAEDFPDRKLTNDSYTHDLTLLARTAGVTGLIAAEEKADAVFKENWFTVRDWGETARYAQWSEQVARDLFDAVADPQHGVLTWIRNHW